MQGDLPTISLPYHFIYLFPKEKQTTIGFKIRNFSSPNPVIDGLLFYFEYFGYIYNVQIFRFQGWADSRIDGLLLQDKQLVEFIFNTHQFIEQAFLPCISCIVI